MITTDWHTEKIVDETLVSDIKEIAEIKMLKEHPNLLVFPHSFGNNDSGLGENCICSFNENDNTISTKNILGFVGRNDTKLTIRSRFTPGKTDNEFDESKEDYFLHYMLQHVFSINLFDLKHSTSKEPIFDFLLYMFPFFLKKALRQGLYKEYQTQNRNDANIRGVIDINRYIRQNVPFAGRIAYRTREYCYDNSVTELVRHTIEFIRTQKLGCGVLNCDTETKDAVSQIVYATNNYVKNDRFSILNKNLRALRHPYYQEYEPLRKICLQILRYEELKYGQKKDEIYGVLFDGAWLWEEYIGKVFSEYKTGIIHKKGRDKLFEKDNIGQNQGIIPDFIRYDNRPVTASFIGDTKYKRIDTNGSYNREDYFQVLSYMFRYSCPIGYLIFPCEKKHLRERTLADGKGTNKLIEFGLPIPQYETDFKTFVGQMHEMENEFIDNGVGDKIK